MEGLPILRENGDAQSPALNIDDRGASSDDWMPIKHKKEHVPTVNGKDEIPDSLKKRYTPSSSLVQLRETEVSATNTIRCSFT